MARRDTDNPYQRMDGGSSFYRPGDLNAPASGGQPNQSAGRVRGYQNSSVAPGGGQSGYYGSDGRYYSDPVYSPEEAYYDDGYEEYYDEGDWDGEYYDDGTEYDGYTPEYDDYYAEPVRRAPTMAERAAGKANTEIYGRASKAYVRQPSARPERTAVRRERYDYEDEYVPPKRKRRKKRHPFRRFMTFLLVLALILGAGYFLLFQAPEPWEDGIHTRKEGLYNILICATDEEEMRTDTSMIATMDLNSGDISLTSVPRDTIVNNGEAVPKLNGVYGLAGGGDAGAEAMLDEMHEILGFRPDGYAVINYEIFRDVVNAMGGVTFDVPMDMVVDNPGTDETLEIPSGEQLLDGDAALGVCRYRYGYMMADIQRQYVQQSFLKALIQQLMSPSNLTKLPGVYSAAMAHVRTNLSGANIRYLALHLLLGGLDDIHQNTLPGEGVDYNGASCYGLYGQSVVDMVNETMNPYEEDITLDDVYILSVSGGMLVESTWSGVAFDASQYVYN